MKINFCGQRERGLTLVEVLVIIVVITFLYLMLLPMNSGRRARAERIRCVNNLRQIGISFRVWKGDQTVTFPMNVRGTNGGTMEFVTGPNAWRHFQVMSNELSTPKILICPSDASRAIASTNFNFLSNSNLSYFIGLDSSDEEPESILSGDRNITNGTPIQNGIFELSTNNPAGWTAEIHNQVGNLLLSDGSVQQVSRTGLRQAIADTGILTNHLQMPVLTP